VRLGIGGGDYSLEVRVSDAKGPADSDACAVSIHLAIEGDDSDGDVLAERPLHRASHSPGSKAAAGKAAN